MPANNNKQVIRRMADRSLKSNRRRSVILFVAVLLSTFMLFTVFTVGITYIKMLRQQNIRLAGADFDAIMYGMTAAQKEKCESDPDVEKTGVTAVAGSVYSTDRDDTINVGLIWADPVFWDEMMAPARKQTEGEYPKEKNQIMATESALKECGYEELSEGDTLVMTWQDGKGGLHTEEFEICGMWDGYGDARVFYVSEAFYEQCGYELADVSSGRYYIEFEQSILTEKEQDEFIESMELGKQQALFFSLEAGYSLPILAGLCGIALCTCLCAWLLIYNILYLSVSGNVRYFGLLQTVGMTGRQVRSLIRRQMVLIGAAGIISGLMLGMAVSFLVVPSVVRSLGVQAKEAGAIEISFHPAVFVLTVCLAVLTLLAGSRKPLKTAENVSPIEAAGYRAEGGKQGIRKTGKGRILFRLAKKELTGDKKRTAVIMLSLGAGLSVFLCLVTLIQSQGPRTYVSNYMDMDMTIENDTMKKEDHDEWMQIIDETFLDRIRDSRQVAEVHPVLAFEIMIPWEEDFADQWMSEFYAKWMTVPYEGEERQEYQEHPENFATFLIGIDEADFDYMNGHLEEPVDAEAFENGETCVLYRNGLDFTSADLTGKSVTCAAYGEPDKIRTFTVAGLTDENYYCGPMLGFPPAVIVSESALREFAGEPAGSGAKEAGTYISKVSIRYQKSYDEETEQTLLSLMEESPYAKDFSHTSKLDELERVKEAQGNMMEIGMGVALVLAFIGILNYINTVTGSIQDRRRKFAVLESVGMTERQLDRMLVMEGLFFAGGSLLVAATVGLAVTYAIYQSMNYMGAPFTVPVMPVLIMAAFILIVCMAVPLVVRCAVMKQGSVIERIRENAE